MAVHEGGDHRDEVSMGGDRPFGMVMAGFFALVGFWPLFSAQVPAWWALAIAVVMFGTAMIRPVVLRPFNRLWFQFGQLLHRVTNPLILGLIYFGVMTPMALGLRLLGKDLLRLRGDPLVKSYWVRREGPPSSMRQQF